MKLYNLFDNILWRTLKGTAAQGTKLKEIPGLFKKFQGIFFYICFCFLFTNVPQ